MHPNPSSGDRPEAHHDVAPRCSHSSACATPCTAQRDGTFHRLCAFHQRETDRPEQPPHERASRFVPYGPRAKVQRHADPLPFELIPFDSGQTVTLRRIPSEELGDLEDLEDLDGWLADAKAWMDRKRDDSDDENEYFVMDV